MDTSGITKSSRTLNNLSKLLVQNKSIEFRSFFYYKRIYRNVLKQAKAYDINNKFNRQIIFQNSTKLFGIIIEKN